MAGEKPQKPQAEVMNVRHKPKRRLFFGLIGAALAAAALYLAATHGGELMSQLAPVLSGGADNRPVVTEQAPAGVVMEPTATATPTFTPTPTVTPTPKPSQTPTPNITATAKAEQEAFMQDVQELRAMFQELAEQYPDGFDGRLIARADFVGMPGIEGLARAGFWVLDDTLKSFDPSMGLWAAFQRFFKDHPDATLVYVMRTDRAVWCKEKWNDFSCQFAGHPVHFAGWLSWKRAQLALGGGLALDEQTAALSRKAKDWIDNGLTGGTLPSWHRDQQGYPTNWKMQVYVFHGGGAIPLFGLEGNTWDAAPYGEGKSLLKGKLNIISAADLPELDAAIQQAIIETYESR